MSMSAIDAVLNLCDIVVDSNNQLCKQIRKGVINEEKLYNYFKNTAITLKKYSKFVESHSSLSAKPGCEEEAREQYNDEEYDKLITRIEKIMQNRQKDIENDKKWSEMDDENDELIDRFNRLKPVVPDFEESKFEEFKEPEFDEFYEPDIEEFEEPDIEEFYEPQFKDFEEPNKFEELNKDANELLINRKRMKKKEFTKKLDIYLIVMKKKLINNPKQYCELKKSIEAFKRKLQRRKKLSNDLINTMLRFVRKNSVINEEVDMTGRLVSLVDYLGKLSCCTKSSGIS